MGIYGIICILATHHFDCLEKSFEEMLRILKSNESIVIFSADPRLCPDDCWLADYFSGIVIESYKIHPPIEDLKKLMEGITKNMVSIVKFPIPCDIKDGFFFSGWRRPEIYLDSVFRAGISSLANSPDDVLNPCLQRLKSDLDSGDWKEKYGHILKLDEFDCGYRFLKTQNVKKSV